MKQQNTKLTVTRNNHDWTFSLTPLRRGKREGYNVFKPHTFDLEDPESVQEFLEFVGMKESASIVYAHLSAKCVQWTRSATSAEGQLSEEAFTQFVQNFSARGESIEALSKQIEELFSSISSLRKNDKLTENQKTTQIMVLVNRIDNIREVIETKRRDKSEKE